MQKTKWWLLQLFADGGEGGSAAGEGSAATATGVSDVDAGHQRLRELGVPESKIRKDREYRVAAKTPAKAEQVQPNEKQTPTATEAPTETPAKRMTWDEIKADPEYSEQLNKMMRDRLRKSKTAEENLGKLTPALEAMAKNYGLDPSNLDYGALAEKIQGDSKLYRERALELGVDEETARKLDQFDLMQAREKRRQEVSVQDQAIQKHYAGLLEQEKALKDKYPNFDLQAELKNPTFARLTAPGMPISVEDAYYLIHRKEIEQAALKAAAQQTTQNISNAVRSGTMRPQENGASSIAPSVSTFSYKNASQKERNALKQRIRSYAARGEKLYPGQ